MDTSNTLLAETLWALLRGGGGGAGGRASHSKLDNVKACNKECHSVLRIYCVIIHYGPLKTNNRAISCHVK